MKIIPNYKNEVLCLPAEVVSEKLSTASREDLLVLLAVMGEREFRVSELAAKLDMTDNTLRRSITFWETAGAFSLESSADRAPAEVTKAQMKEKGSRPQAQTLPHYSSEEMASVIQRTPGSQALLDSCQQTLGKIFNVAESSILLGLRDHLSLAPDYILLLCSTAAERGKPSLRYVEKMALEYFDRDILTYAALEAELNAQAERKSLEHFVRDLFGVGRRSLIKKEKDYLTNWVDTWGFSREMIRLAYEKTVEKTNEPNFAYANAILERWQAAGIRTPEDAAAADEKHAANRQASVPAGTSFATDSFYEAALQRSYGDDAKK